MSAHTRYKIPPAEVPKIVFKYTALPTDSPSLRLLTLDSGYGGAPIKCSLSNHLWDVESGIVRPIEVIYTGSSSEPRDQLCHELSSLRSSSPSRSLDQIITYEALSYVWGDTDQMYSITVDNQVFAINRNLLEGLFYLRDGNSSRTLWIDAICINQNDAVEKGHQIRQMQHIYRHASRVIAWLGIAVRNSNLAFDFAKKLYCCIPEEWRRGKEGELENERGGRIDELTYEIYTNHLLTSEYAREWLGLSHLFKRPYWARAWVFQEVVMAQEIVFVCGPKSLNWGIMDFAMQLSLQQALKIQNLINSSTPIADQDTLFPIDEKNPFFWGQKTSRWLLGIHEGRHYMIGLKASESRAAPSQTMERYLALIQNRRCKYQHDKIHSILGLLSPEVVKFIPDPDYSSPASNTYKHAVKAFALGTLSLNILCLAHHTDTNTQEDSPSWVFDWRRESRLSSINDIASVLGTAPQRSWHSATMKRYPPSFSEDLSRISVFGIKLSVIKFTGLEKEHLPSLVKTTKFQEDFDEFSQPTTHHGGYTMERWEFRDDAEKILGSDAGPHSPMVFEDEGATLLAMVLFKRDPARLSSMNIRKDAKVSRFSKNLGNDNFNGIYDYMRYICKCRTIVETNALELALTPSWAQSGNLIAQFVGCTAPVVLRQLNDGTHTFIGDCYVLGKMGGAMIKILEEVMEGQEGLRKFDLV